MRRSINAISSHNTSEHRDNYRRGSNVPGEFASLANHNPGIKADSNYLPIVHYDTGASDHFFTDRPDSSYTPCSNLGDVQTASGDSYPIVGRGDQTIGKLLLTDVKHVPAFTKNLVSGSKLAYESH